MMTAADLGRTLDEMAPRLERFYGDPAIPRERKDEMWRDVEGLVLRHKVLMAKEAGEVTLAKYGITSPDALRQADIRQAIYSGGDIPGMVRKTWQGAAQAEGEVTDEVVVCAGWASTDAMDSYGDIVDTEAWGKPEAFARFQQNPVLQWAHLGTILPVGKVTDLEPRGSGLWVTMEIHSAPVGQLVKRGILKGLSIGFRPISAKAVNPDRPQDRGRRFKALELLEISLCNVPACPTAIIVEVQRGKPA